MRRFIRHYSQVKRLLNRFVADQVVEKPQRGTRVQKSAPISPQKLLIQLQQRYDAHQWQFADGKPISLQKLRPSDLNTNSPKSKVIFDNLLHFKKLTKRAIPPPFIHALLGVTPAQLKDEFIVTKTTRALLERDSDPARAEYLARMAGLNGAVAMNNIMQWLFARGRIDDGWRSFHNRKRWGVPCNDQTYILLFSGLSQATEWGKLSSETAQKVVQIFAGVDLKGENATPTFNAALLVLVKLWDNDQQAAWDFFDHAVPDPQGKVDIIPDCQSFTVLLNGVKKRVEHTRPPGWQQLLSAIAETIYAKVIAGATPPVPPTKEQARDSPAMLVSYKQKARRKLLSIDEAFVSVFVGCFTGPLVPRGFAYLRAFNPEIDTLFQVLGDQAMKPTKNVKFHNGDEEPNLPALPSAEEINPLVVFPPPLTSKNKARALFSNKQKRLVDFTRPTYGETRAAYLDWQYQRTQGKYGRKMRTSVDSANREPRINRFHLQYILDGLIAMGRYREFTETIFKVLERYQSQEGAIDAGTVENFIFKINAHGRRQGQSHLEDIVLVFLKAVATSTTNGIDLVRQQAIDGVFASIITTLHYYNDFNLNQLKKAGMPNIPRKTITEAQLIQVSLILPQYVEALGAYFTKDRPDPAYLVPNYIIEPINKIFDRLYASTWIQDSGKIVGDKDAFAAHMQLAKAGIRMYLPRLVRNPSKIVSLEILPSLEYIYNALNERQDLDKQEARLMKLIRLLISIRTSTQGDHDKAGYLRTQIYELL